MTRKAAQAAYIGVNMHSEGYVDTFCLRPSGVRAGYPGPRMLALVRPTERARFVGRVVWALTANSDFTLGRLRPGGPLGHPPRASVAKHGPDLWYFVPGRQATDVIEAHGKIVQALGIAEAGLAKTGAGRVALVKSFG
jgi:hypothetical protein